MERFPGLPVLRLHHLGVLADDLDAAVRFYSGFLGVAGGERHEAPEQDIQAILFDIGDSHIEVFAPLTADGPIARTLAKRGAGLHHVAYEVADIGAALEACRAAGLQLIDTAPRPGLRRDWRVAFLHPRAAGGVLTELLQTAAPWPGTGL